eukprot:15476641-Alexandrium_andersonii.AAC.1
MPRSERLLPAPWTSRTAPGVHQERNALAKPGRAGPGPARPTVLGELYIAGSQKVQSAIHPRP